jgi:hypothetical protein
MTDQSQEDKDNNARFEEIIKGTNETIRAEATRLMDIHHESIQHSRTVIESLVGFNDRYQDIIRSIVEAHAIAAKDIADLYGDMIVAELGGIVEIDIDDEDVDEDESE